MRFSQDTQISPERISRMLEDERKKMQFGDMGPLEAIEEKIFDVHLNGYNIADWKNKACRDLQVSYALSAGSKESVKSMRGAAKLIVSDKKIHFHSSLLLQYMALRYDLEPDRDSYMLVHAHGELTDVVIVKNGLCAFFGSFPIGINSVVRKIAKASMTDDRTADSLLSLYIGDKLEESHARKTDLVVGSVSKMWGDEMSKILHGSELNDWLPDTVFVLTRSHEEFFLKGLASVMPKSKIESLAPDMVRMYSLAIRHFVI